MVSTKRYDAGESPVDSPYLLQEWEGPAVLLVDLDAFFASVEQLDHPGWRGEPVIVGGHPDKRGVVSTASYEARVFGVRSAMPSSTAQRLCPHAHWTIGHFGRYREMSDKVMSILFDETPHVQQVSIDEAFMDVTPSVVNREHPVAIAQRIQRRVEELGITCSIGVGSTKSVAKIASDMDKPRGLTVVMPGGELNFLAPLPVRSLSGVGPAAEKKLKDLGIRTLGDLHGADDEMVIRALGKTGRMLLDRVRGHESAPIGPDESVKSVSNETSFSTDVSSREDVQAAVRTMAAKVGRRLRRKGLAGRTLTLKVRYENLTVRSAQCQMEKPTDNEYDLYEYLPALLDEVWREGVALRLVGVAVTGFDCSGDDDQLSLFEDENEPAKDTVARQSLVNATDKVKDRFGEGALRFGRELRMGGNTTGSSSKNPADYK